MFPSLSYFPTISPAFPTIFHIIFLFSHHSSHRCSLLSYHFLPFSHQFSLDVHHLPHIFPAFPTISLPFSPKFSQCPSHLPLPFPRRRGTSAGRPRAFQRPRAARRPNAAAPGPRSPAVVRPRAAARPRRGWGGRLRVAAQRWLTMAMGISWEK